MTCFGGPTETLGGVRESLLLGDRLPSTVQLGSSLPVPAPQLWDFSMWASGCLPPCLLVALPLGSVSQGGQVSAGTTQNKQSVWAGGPSASS